MGDAARAQAVASKSCLYRRNGLEISIPFLDSALSHWLLNLHVAVGDWPKLRSVAPENEDHPKPPFSNRLRPHRHTPETSADSFCGSCERPPLFASRPKCARNTNLGNYRDERYVPADDVPGTHGSHASASRVSGLWAIAPRRRRFCFLAIRLASRGASSLTFRAVPFLPPQPLSSWRSSSPSWRSPPPTRPR